MKDKYLYALSACLYLVFICSAVCILVADFLFPEITNAAKIVTTFILFLSEILGTYFLCLQLKDTEKCEKAKKISAIVLFAVYIAVVIDFTLIDGSFGRSISNFFALTDSEKVKYLSSNTNFIPFATISLFIKGFIANKVSFFNATVNLLGNIIVFCPFAYFFPKLFKRINTTLKFTLTLTAFVVLIELLQLVFLTGSTDIDDLILNIPTAVITYMVFKHKGIFSKEV